MDEEINDNLLLPPAPADSNSCDTETILDTTKLATKGSCGPLLQLNFKKKGTEMDCTT
jgi:hypothetical protein